MPELFIKHSTEVELLCVTWCFNFEWRRATFFVTQSFTKVLNKTTFHIVVKATAIIRVPPCLLTKKNVLLQRTTMISLKPLFAN